MCISLNWSNTVLEYLLGFRTKNPTISFRKGRIINLSVSGISLALILPNTSCILWLLEPWQLAVTTRDACRADSFLQDQHFIRRAFRIWKGRYGPPAWRCYLRANGKITTCSNRLLSANLLAWTERISSQRCEQKSSPKQLGTQRF